jgi:hypothetical protein
MRSPPVDNIATVMAMRTARPMANLMASCISIGETLTQAQLGIPFHQIIAVSTLSALNKFVESTCGPN